MDETGLAIGVRENGLVLGSSAKKFALKKQSGIRFWTTIIECISATGSRLNPLVIFKGNSVQDQWFTSDLEPYRNWQFGATNRGWTSDEIAVEWLQKVFIPETKPQAGERRLLLVDGHGSHCTDEFLIECYLNNIFIVFLPAHSSHVLQPLDVAVFGPVKRFYTRELGNRPNDFESLPTANRIFLECYSIAREAGISSKNIRAGWAGSGMWPVSRAKPLMSPLLITTPTKVVITPEKKGIQPNFEMHTPANKSELKRLFQDFCTADSDVKMTRLVHRKIIKRFDTQNVALSLSKARIQQLEAQIDLLKPRKRKKVKTNPNTKFVQVIDIENTRRELEAQLQGNQSQPIISLEESDISGNEAIK